MSSTPLKLSRERIQARAYAPPVTVRRAAAATPASDGAPIWAPFPGTPQAAAYHSDADVLGFGGAAGGGKTDLLLGLAATAHRRSLLLRATFPEVRGIIERSRETFARAESRAKDSYNEQLHLWRLQDGRQIEFGSCQYEKDREKYRGRPYDLYGFDEATGFSEAVVRFISGWNRTNVPGQRCRVVLTFNPPSTEAGRWVIRYFLPWMAYLHPDLDECKAYTGAPAAPGEVRWYLMVGGVETEVPAGTPRARSRTFYPASVEDNPVYMAQGYDVTLESLPEPLRSQMRYGSFTAGVRADPWQVIPRAWATAATRRWSPDGRRGPLTALGVDVARGGADETLIAPRHGMWVAPLIAYPGADTPRGQDVAGQVIAHHADGAPILIDVIGVGSSPYDFLQGLGLPVVGVNVGAKSAATDRSGRLRFANKRAELWWRVREALDPDGPDPLALPPDDRLINDLCAPRWEVTPRGILIESKDDLRRRLGRSPDRADAVALSLDVSGFSWGLL